MKKIALLILLSCFPALLFAGRETLHKSAIDALVTPTLLLGQGRYAQAADSFHTQSTIVLTLEKQLGAKGMWQVAGLSEGLAAIAAEKNNDPIAYEYWSNSVRYFLMSGGSWEQLQSELHQEFEQSSTRLQVNMAPGDTGVSLDNTWLQLFSLVEVWQNRLDYFSYRAPSSDLAQPVVKGVQQKIPQKKASSGSQLRQYSQKKQLQLNDAFKTKQAFKPDPNALIQKSKPSSETQKRVPTVVVKTTVKTAEVKRLGSHTALGNNAEDNTAKSNTAEDRAENRNTAQSFPPKLNPKSEQVVIATPIIVDGEIIEQDQSAYISKLKEKALKEEVSASSEDKQISRGNLGAESSKGVTASQRRSFAPQEE